MLDPCALSFQKQIFVRGSKRITCCRVLLVKFSINSFLLNVCALENVSGDQAGFIAVKASKNE